MTLGEAIEKNPFDEKIGDESAYVRYLRYNVDGLYGRSSKEVKAMWKEYEND